MQRQDADRKREAQRKEALGLEDIPAHVVSKMLTMAAWQDIEEVRCTCRSLREICDAQLIEVFARLPVPPSSWDRMLAVGPRLKTLDLQECKAATEAQLCSLLGACGNLRELRLHNAALGGVEVQALLDAGPPLEVLELSGMVACSESLCVELVRKFGSRLRSLNLGNALGVGRLASLEIMRSCKSLERLELFESPLLNIFELFPDRPLKVLSLRACRLERLRMRGGSEAAKGPAAAAGMPPPDGLPLGETHAGSAADAESRPGLGIEPLPDGCAPAVEGANGSTSSASRVEALDLRFNHWLDFSQVNGFTSLLPRLRKLWLSGSCTPIGVRNELKLRDLASLEEVDLEACASLTKLHISHCPRLSVLNLGACDQLMEVDIHGASQLKNLELQLLVNLMSVSLNELPRLRFVNLCGCYALDVASDVRMENVPKSCIVIKADRFTHLVS